LKPPNSKFINPKIFDKSLITPLPGFSNHVFQGGKTYEIEFCTTLLCIEVVALEVREGDDEVDQDEEETSCVQQAKRKQEDVAEKSHLQTVMINCSFCFANNLCQEQKKQNS
jgi:hypothetical protein